MTMLAAVGVVAEAEVEAGFCGVGEGEGGGR